MFGGTTTHRAHRSVRRPQATSKCALGGDAIFEIEYELSLSCWPEEKKQEIERTEKECLNFQLSVHVLRFFMFTEDLRAKWLPCGGFERSTQRTSHRGKFVLSLRTDRSSKIHSFYIFESSRGDLCQFSRWSYSKYCRERNTHHSYKVKEFMYLTTEPVSWLRLLSASFSMFFKSTSRYFWWAKTGHCCTRETFDEENSFTKKLRKKNNWTRPSAKPANLDAAEWRGALRPQRKTRPWGSAWNRVGSFRLIPHRAEGWGRTRSFKNKEQTNQEAVHRHKTPTDDSSVKRQLLFLPCLQHYPFICFFSVFPMVTGGDGFLSGFIHQMAKVIMGTSGKYL